MFPIEKSTMTTEVATPNRIPLSRELLTTMTECPGCGAAMQYRSLAYKHRCPKPVSETERAAERERRMKELQQRVTNNFNKRVRNYADTTKEDGPGNSQ